MRLINADEHECWACTHHQNETGKCDTWCDAGESFELREDVKEAKTAFDVEAVAKELEEYVEQHKDYYQIGEDFLGYGECISLKKVIEIVRKAV